MLSGNFSIIKKEKSFFVLRCVLFFFYFGCFVVIFNVSFLCKFTQP